MYYLKIRDTKNELPGLDYTWATDQTSYPGFWGMFKQIVYV